MWSLRAPWSRGAIIIGWTPLSVSIAAAHQGQKEGHGEPVVHRAKGNVQGVSAKALVVFLRSC